MARLKKLAEPFLRDPDRTSVAECAAYMDECASVFVDWSLMDKEMILKLSPDYIIKEMRELSCIIFDGEL